VRLSRATVGAQHWGDGPVKHRPDWRMGQGDLDPGPETYGGFVLPVRAPAENGNQAGDYEVRYGNEKKTEDGFGRGGNLPNLLG